MPSRDRRSPQHIAALAICLLLATAGILKVIADGGLIGWLLAGFLVPGLRFLVAPGPGELALVARLVAALVAGTVVLVLGVFLVLESGEVVVLRYDDGRGGLAEDRLWVVDLEGRPSVTTGADTGRAALIRAHPRVELLRRGQVECRQATVVAASEATPEDRSAAERLFEAKYGLRLHASRALRAFLGGPGAEPVLVRLDPCPASETSQLARPAGFFEFGSVWSASLRSEGGRSALLRRALRGAAGGSGTARVRRA